MSISSIMSQLLLSPITLVLEAVFALAYFILGSCGAAIFPLSFAVNMLLLPFYNKADAIQAEERNRQEQMTPFVEHIKKTFKGDERYMMLQSFYKENNYKPVYALRSSIALILEVPFFIAAYNFLSNLSLLQGTPFLFLKDLGKPDELFAIGGITINILPVLMTLINVFSSEIYTRGQKFKNKITLHGMALIFLVLLYNSPSGLVLYWTLNNIFSLVKNIINTSSDKSKSKKTVFSIVSILIIVYGLVFNGTRLTKLYILLVSVLFLLPVLMHRKKKKETNGKQSPPDYKLFFLGTIFLSVFLGTLIPSYVIVASPSEFILITSVHSPVRYILFAFLTAFGAFVIWGSLFYYLSGEKARKRANIAIWCFGLISVINFLLFGKSENILNADLQFDGGLFLKPTSVLWNFLLVSSFIAVVIFFMRRSTRVIRFLAPILLAVAVILSGYNIIKIEGSMSEIRRVTENSSTKIPQLSFSKDGKNVVVIMLDRAIPSYLPYIFNERSDLVQEFSGFVWYPNTLSFGFRTVVAAPALFGGYDYTPERIDSRRNELLVNKHNEALLTMPILFSDSGYDVTVLDPPFANYSKYPDLSIYEPYPDIKAYNTEVGLFRHSTEDDKQVSSAWKRNFFCYSLMKSSPLLFQPILYTNGSYFAPKNRESSISAGETNSTSYYISQAAMNLFCDSYNALKAYPSMTSIDTSSNNHFFLIQNSTTHNTIPLKEPEYEPRQIVNNSEYDETHQNRFIYNDQILKMENQDQLTHYQCNMAAWIQLGKWMDYLKEIGVYDNTRIIIVSDHGWPIENRDDMLFLDGKDNDAKYNSKDAMAYNPLLFVKDFGATGDYTIDYTFMTNADTPYLAMKDLIDNQVNPFTNSPIYQPDAKNADKMYVLYTDNWNPIKDSTQFDAEGVNIWYSLYNQDIFDMENWHEETVEP